MGNFGAFVPLVRLVDLISPARAEPGTPVALTRLGQAVTGIFHLSPLRTNQDHSSPLRQRRIRD